MELQEPFNGWPGVPEPVKGRVENQSTALWTSTWEPFLFGLPPPWQRMLDKLNHSPMQPSTHPYEQIFTESHVRYWICCWGYKSYRVMTSLQLNKLHQDKSAVTICIYSTTHLSIHPNESLSCFVFGRDILNSDNGEILLATYWHIPYLWAFLDDGLWGRKGGKQLELIVNF